MSYINIHLRLVAVNVKSIDAGDVSGFLFAKAIDDMDVSLKIIVDQSLVSSEQAGAEEFVFVTVHYILKWKSVSVTSIIAENVFNVQTANDALIDPRDRTKGLKKDVLLDLALNSLSQTRGIHQQAIKNRNIADCTIPILTKSQLTVNEVPRP